MSAAGVWQISHMDLILRMVLAVVLGGLIGLEREWNNHAAGFRTHILVCLGSATIMLLSEYGFSDFVNEANVRIDPSRLAAQVVSGIGFLGAGAILRNGNVIKGLTTAASVWLVAAIGLSVGAGFITGALVCTFLVLVSLYTLNKLEKHILRHRRTHVVEITINEHPGFLSSLNARFGEQGIQVINLKMIQESDAALSSDGNTSPLPVMHLVFSLRCPKQEKLMAAYEQISALDTVVSMEAANFVFHKQAA
ncbi:MgtC/SapB family protein [Paenibacillus roseipurpureus]|uniref:MgtC/SapB family protein n=1 Tax=Paenibacillus roseopurpureus TaxID=2918901 RepID=A0AA96RJF6_9BACL|nr:MgtC/SapB family protein [Paenibacillus sp. MBLB1832]WNR43116.1 MgtC/SapB family protein [Paenibacillus sp. MBLB1832]